MKIILLEDIKKQGKKGAILEVKDGYGSFLIKNKQAVAASQGSLNRLQKENEQKAMELAKDIKDAENLRAKLETIELSFQVKTGEGDRVFGSVSPKQIADRLKENGFAIDKKQIKPTTNLASLGYHNVDIELHKKVSARIRVLLNK